MSVEVKPRPMAYVISFSVNVRTKIGSRSRAARSSTTPLICAIDKLPGSVHGGAPRPAVPRPPAADGIEVLERQAGGVDHPMAACTRRIAAMLLHALAHRFGLAAPASSSNGARRRRGGGGDPRMFSRIHRAGRRSPQWMTSPSARHLCPAARAAVVFEGHAAGSASRRRLGCRSARRVAR